jgi:hypothetical protein
VLALGRWNFENTETTEINWNVDKLEFSVRCPEIFFCCINLDSFMYNPCSTLVFQILIHYLRLGSSCAESLSRNSFHFASSSRRSAKFPSGLESQFVQRLQCASADHRTRHREHWGNFVTSLSECSGKILRSVLKLTNLNSPTNWTSMSFDVYNLVKISTAHHDRFLVNKTNRCTDFQFYWYYDSTCFGQSFCPSSGVS